MNMIRALGLSLLLSLSLYGCGDDDNPVDGGATTDASATEDAGGEDAATDTGEPDASEADAGEPDAGEADAGEADAGEADAGEADAGEADASTPDAGEVDAGEPDASMMDASRPDIGIDDRCRPSGMLCRDVSECGTRSHDCYRPEGSRSGVCLFFRREPCRRGRCADGQVCLTELGGTEAGCVSELEFECVCAGAAGSRFNCR